MLLILGFAVDLTKDAPDGLPLVLYAVALFFALLALFSIALKRKPSLLEWLPIPDAWAQSNTATPVELMDNHVSGKTFRISDVVVDGRVFNRTFEDCTIIGPAVVAVSGYGSLYECLYKFSTKVDNLFLAFDYEPDKTPLSDFPEGVVVCEKCVFKRCLFQKITWIGTKESIAKHRQTITSGPSD